MTRPRGWEIVERVRAGELLVFDGGYGTALFDAGLVDGHCPEIWNDSHAEVVRSIHKGYFDAGSDIVETNTFGASRLKLKEYNERYGYAVTDRTRELNAVGAQLARSVCPGHGFVAGSIGPTSSIPADFGVGDNVATDEEYLETFKEQAEALAEGGVDIFAVETMMFPQEATAAIQACKAVTDLPVMATMFFQYEELHDRDRTMWGESPGDVARTLLAAGADIVGMNCGRGPDRAITILREMRAATDAPLIAYPNAGLPVTTSNGRTTYELGPEAMVKDYPALLDVGASIVGGCCGSGPEHIRLIAEVVRSRRKR
jgi:5-methyltetrahydrofolate--homocysteine methyltransferase